MAQETVGEPVTMPDSPTPAAIAAARLEEVARIINEAEALNLRSSMNQHAKLLDDAALMESPSVTMTVTVSSVRIVLSLLDEHEAMNRRLSEALAKAKAILDGQEDAEFVEIMDEPEQIDDYGVGWFISATCGGSPVRAAMKVFPSPKRPPPPPEQDQ